MTVVAELSPNGKAVDVTFPYSPDFVLKIKRVTRSFVPKEKGGPYWRVQKDVTAMRRLREQFGAELELGPKLRKWGQEEVSKERNLKDLSTADDAELENVPKPLIKGTKLPSGKKFSLRPYQKADVQFMAQGKFVNANQPGSGKTAEYICTILELGLEWGQHLIFAPVTSLELVWEFEIREMYGGAGLDEPTIYTGDTPATRKRAVAEAKAASDRSEAFWLVLNPHMAQIKRALKKGVKEARYKTDYEDRLTHPELAEIDWDSMNIDEFHLCGLSNPSTQTSQGLNYIANVTDPGVRGCMSGTPMGGKPIKLHGALKFIDPAKFRSRWNWARQWLIVNDNGFGKEIEGIMPGREQEFYDHLKAYLVRRTKHEVLPGLPPKNRIDVWCNMTPKQAAQYQQFESEAEVRMDAADGEGRLTATNILAEYARLKQFASAYCNIKKVGWDDTLDAPEIKVQQTLDSGKFEQLTEKLREENVIAKGKDDDDAKCALIFSQFNGVVLAVLDLCRKEGIPAVTITGATSGRDRKAVATAFQEQGIEHLLDVVRPTTVMRQLLKDGPPRVMVMNTKAGGTTLTLTQADSVHILDETWVPDDQEQAEDRAHRGDDKTMIKDEVRNYYYRTRKSIEEMIMQLVADKELNNKVILDLRRQMAQKASDGVPS